MSTIRVIASRESRTVRGKPGWLAWLAISFTLGLTPAVGLGQETSAVDGNWEGQTTQGHKISLIVKDGILRYLSVGTRLPQPGCLLETSFEDQFGTSIIGSRFSRTGGGTSSYTIEGAIADGKASGSIQFRVREHFLGPVRCAEQHLTVSWSAARTSRVPSFFALDAGVPAKVHIEHYSFHPAADSTVYAIGWFFTRRDESALHGLLRSVDGGATWTAVAGGELESSAPLVGGGYHHASDFAFHRSREGTLILATREGLRVSTDGGVSWALRLAGSEVRNVAVAPDQPNRLFAVLGGDSSAIVRSGDGGGSWQSLGETPWYAMEAAGLLSAVGLGDTLYFFTGSMPKANIFGSLYRSINGGASWALLNGDVVAFTLLRTHEGTDPLVLLRGSRGNRQFVRGLDRATGDLDTISVPISYGLAGGPDGLVCGLREADSSDSTGVHCSRDRGVTWELLGNKLLPFSFATLYTSGQSLLAVGSDLNNFFRWDRSGWTEIEGVVSPTGSRP